MKKILLLLYFFALFGLTMLAQTGQPRIVHSKEQSAIHVPPQEAPPCLERIYSNLGKSKTDLYETEIGWGIFGPNSSSGFTEFVGMPFTPKSNAQVEQVRVALWYFGSGANQVNLSIYADAGGGPGTLLAGPVTVTNLPPSGTCCSLAVAKFTRLAVTCGTRYWVVADTPLTGIGSDSEATWAFIPTHIPQAFNNGSGWSVDNGLTQEAAGEVLGVRDDSVSWRCR